MNLFCENGICLYFKVDSHFKFPIFLPTFADYGSCTPHHYWLKSSLCKDRWIDVSIESHLHFQVKLVFLLFIVVYSVSWHPSLIRNWNYLIGWLILFPEWLLQSFYIKDWTEIERRSDWQMWFYRNVINNQWWWGIKKSNICKKTWKFENVDHLNRHI